jgi:hypothetical protein
MLRSTSPYQSEQPCATHRSDLQLTNLHECKKCSMSLNEDCYDDLGCSDLFKVDSFQNFLDLHGVGTFDPDFSEDGAHEPISESVSIESGGSPQKQFPLGSVPVKCENGKSTSEDGPYDHHQSAEGTPEGRRKPRRDPEKNRNAQVCHLQALLRLRGTSPVLQVQMTPQAMCFASSDVSWITNLVRLESEAGVCVFVCRLDIDKRYSPHPSPEKGTICWQAQIIFGDSDLRNETISSAS